MLHSTLQGHAGVGVTSLGRAPLSAPTLVTPEFLEFYEFGRALRVTLPAGSGSVVHLFVVYGYQGAEEDSEKLLLTDKLLRAALAEAQVVCVGQPLLIAGDLNADRCVVPLLRVSLLVSLLIWLWYIPLGAGREPDPTSRFKLDEGGGSRRDFTVACLNALAASTACRITDRWFTPHFSVFAEFSIGRWAAEVSYPGSCQHVWPACWIDTPDRSSSSVTGSVQDAWDV